MANERSETWQQQRAKKITPKKETPQTLGTPAKKTVEPKVISTKVETPKKTEDPVKVESKKTATKKDEE